LDSWETTSFSVVEGCCKESKKTTKGWREKSPDDLKNDFGVAAGKDRHAFYEMH
jgi:hypothetical protein